LYNFPLIISGLPESQKAGIVNADTINNSLPCQCCCNRDPNQQVEPGSKDPEPDPHPEPLTPSSAHQDPIDDPVPEYELEPSPLLQQQHNQKQQQQQQQHNQSHHHDNEQEQKEDQSQKEQQDKEQQCCDFPSSDREWSERMTCNSSTQTVNNFAFALSKWPSAKLPSLSLTQEVPDVLL
jgi:hypothetical protein